MQNIPFKWDTAWKYLCNTHYDFAPVILSRLLGEQYAGYAVEFIDSSDQAEYTSSVTGHQYKLDKIILANVDNKVRKIHLEFQSISDKEMGRRMLEYGIQSRVGSSFDSTTETETLILPDAFIVIVRDVSGFASGRRALNLQMNGQVVTLQWPVIKALRNIPEIREMMYAPSLEDAFIARQKFMRSLPSQSPDSDGQAILELVCNLISCTDRHWDDTIPKEEVIRMEQQFRQHKKTYGELWDEQAEARGYERGRKEAQEQAYAAGYQAAKEKEAARAGALVREEHIQNLMKVLSISREQAISYLSGKPYSGSQMNKMNLQ